MILKTNFDKRFFRPVSPEISEQGIVFIPKLNVVRDAGFALNFYYIDKFISNQCLVFINLISFAIQKLNFTKKQYTSKV